DGSLQELVRGGSAVGGTMYYALRSKPVDRPANKVYTTAVPTGTGVGDYYVWYKVVGDDNHNDTEPAEIPVTIGKASVDVPTIDSRAYTGEVQTATVPESTLYTVTSNNGGTYPGHYDVVLTLTNTDNCRWADSDEVSRTLDFEITKAESIPAAVTANNRIYDTTEQPLASANESVLAGGTMYYALGSGADTAPADNLYTTSIPTAADIGTYYVWYKVVGDDNHSDTEPVCIAVTIASDNEEVPSPEPETEAVEPPAPETEAPVTPAPETEAPAPDITPPEAAEDSSEAKTQIAAGILLNSKFLVSWKGNKVQVRWGSVTGADTYEIYAGYCGKKKYEKIMTVHAGSKLTFNRLNGKKLNPKKAVKAYVAAYRNGVNIGRTIIGHAAGPKNSYTNAKKVKTSKSTYKLKQGKTAKIKAVTVKEKNGKRLVGKSHGPEYRYASSDENVAVVDKKGRIKAVGTGTCNIWIFAQNGRSRKVTVRVVIR
ncbi:MAG: Ig-like domain-containing protein, partial [Lachnospiraceae bacterium]|nr:Ig-like domain-containing protein [Lachnospiraceae bacterium]